ncbi:MAG: FHA domain-containing protein [Chloroflexi bacterium]|nr:FHA domain-containing protein [Chloroflexota bacterium]
MPDTITCPTCQTENDPGNDLCQHCGRWLGDEKSATLLGPTTIHLRDEILQRLEQQGRFQDALHLSDNELVIRVANKEAIIRMKYEHPIVLGRQAKLRTDLLSFVDLSEYEAYALGVSRKHAQLQREGDYFLLTDLGSANGTYINGQRMKVHMQYQLETGQQIMLGELPIYLYYR